MDFVWYFCFNLCEHIPPSSLQTHTFISPPKFNVTDSHHSGLMTDQSGIAALLTASLCLFSLLHTHTCMQLLHTSFTHSLSGSAVTFSQHKCSLAAQQTTGQKADLLSKCVLLNPQRVVLFNFSS